MARQKHAAEEPAEMTFFEHLDALRPHLMRGAIALLVVAFAAFFLKDWIIDGLLFGPAQPDFPSNRVLGRLARLVGSSDFQAGQTEFNIINTRMAGQFNLQITVSIVTGLVLTIPYLMWELWCFIRPGLTYYERRRTNLFVLYVSICFFVGLLFGYYVITPLAVNFLTGWVASPTIVNMIDSASYLKTVITTSLACALIFQLPILIYFLTRMGVVGAAFLKKYRKHAIVVLAILSALITPPDMLSMILVMLPLVLLYELSIKIAVRVEKTKAAEEAALKNE
jgi:sec-independent protein translocase protein TatC